MAETQRRAQRTVSAFTALVPGHLREKLRGVTTDAGLREVMKKEDDQGDICAGVILQILETEVLLDDPPPPPPPSKKKKRKIDTVQPQPRPQSAVAARPRPAVAPAAAPPPEAAAAAAAVAAAVVVHKPPRSDRPVRKPFKTTSGFVDFIDKLEDYTDDLEEYAEVLEKHSKRQKTRFGAIIERLQRSAAERRKRCLTLEQENEVLETKLRVLRSHVDKLEGQLEQATKCRAFVKPEKRVVETARDKEARELAALMKAGEGDSDVEAMRHVGHGLTLEEIGLKPRNDDDDIDFGDDDF